LSEIVGSSPTSVDDAVRTAIRKASETVRNIEWFQTEEIRGQVLDGDVAHYQVRLKIGFRVED
jgi:flavin-binding protein dodecin